MKALLAQGSDPFHTFWEKHPALLYGLVLLLGALFTLKTPWALVPLPLLIHKKNLLPLLLLFLLPCCLIYHFYSFPPSHAKVTGTFAIHTLRRSEKFGKGWSYRGVLKTPQGKIPCRCFSSQNLCPKTLYTVKGEVRKLKGIGYVLKPLESFTPQKRRFSLATWRFQRQEAVKGYITRHMGDGAPAHFLNGMITGALEDKVLMQAFNQLGLSHLMAISGFHFALLALVCHLFLRLFLPAKIEALCLMALLTLYFLFVGMTPSILRAYTVAMVLLIGQIIERRTSSLNALGVALALSVLLQPLSTVTLSFQLSFLATAGILFYYPICDQLLQLWLPKRSLSEAITRSLFWQQVYILFSLFREALALTLAVHLAVLPLLITCFHTFSLNSLLYNLFFPFLATLALLFFIASLFLGHWAHVFNTYYCNWILRISHSPPLVFKTFYLPHVPGWILSLCLTGLLIVALIFYKSEKREENKWFWRRG